MFQFCYWKGNQNLSIMKKNIKKISKLELEEMTKIVGGNTNLQLNLINSEQFASLAQSAVPGGGGDYETNAKEGYVANLPSFPSKN